jgi:hypothetical protein
MSQLAELTQCLTARSSVTAEDVLAMGRLVWGDGVVSAEETEAIMALNSGCHIRSREWVDYLVEVIVDYIVRQQHPAGYVDNAKADWLIRWVDRDGHVESLAELELLVKVSEVSESVPETLRSYALLQIELAVMSGSGPTRTQRHDGDGALDPRCINATEVYLLRRTVFAVSGDGNYVVSQAEAEMLFRLKGATLGADNAPGWADLFVKAVGDHLMGHVSYRPLTQQAQLDLDAYVADTTVSMVRFAGRAFGRRTTDPRAGVSVENDRRATARPSAVVDAQITPNEKGWLTSRIQADGTHDSLEIEPIYFIRRERSGL